MLHSRQASSQTKNTELEAQLLHEIQSLPKQMKEVLILKYFENKQRKEIALTLGISENTVKTQLKRGKKKLFEQLNDRKLIALLPLFHQLMNQDF